MSGRADERDVDELRVGQEIIANPQDQGLFGPDDDQIDLVLECSSGHGGKIVGMHWQVGSKGSGAGITGRNKQAAAKWALFDFPGKGVFSTPASQQKDIHLFLRKYRVKRRQ